MHCQITDDGHRAIQSLFEKTNVTTAETRGPLVIVWTQLNFLALIKAFFFFREREISFTICQNHIAINVYLDYINNWATPREVKLVVPG